MPERREKDPAATVSRRRFFHDVGGGVMATATAGGLAGLGQEVKGSTEGLRTRTAEPAAIHLRVNGREFVVSVEPRWSLLDVLRDRLRLTGTKKGCGQGECGACTVLIDGKPVYACLTLAVQCEGAEITTVEGLAKGNELHPVQRAFIEQDASQCGFCTPGQIMSAAALLSEDPAANLEQIKKGMSGNLCRCGTYPKILKAVASCQRSS